MEPVGLEQLFRKLREAGNFVSATDEHLRRFSAENGAEDM
jgi:hypothetical protein